MSLSVLPDESALDLFRRVQCRPLRTGLSFLDDAAASCGLGGLDDGRGGGSSSGVFPGDVFEIYGGSGCAKSEILINVAVRCILPQDLGGEERCVYYFDNDCRFSLMRTEHILRERIGTSAGYLTRSCAVPKLRNPNGFPEFCAEKEEEGAGGDSEAFLRAVMLGCLRRLKLVRCGSAMEVLAAAEVLHAELEETSAVVIVDSLGSFVHQERLAAAHSGSPAVDMQAGAIRAFAKLAQERPVMLFAAKPALFAQRSNNNNSNGSGGSSANSHSEHKEYLPAAWQRAVSYRVEVQFRSAAGSSRNPRKRETLGAKRFSEFSARVTAPAGGRRRQSGGGGPAAAAAAVSGAEDFGARTDRAHPFIVTDAGVECLPMPSFVPQQRWEAVSARVGIQSTQ